MKTTGVVRRIDDLGRIVIPKEIRRTLRIKDGESLEIFLESENIVLKKYSSMENLENFYRNYVDSVQSEIGENILITNKDFIIAASGPLKKKYIGKNIGKIIEEALNNSKNLIQLERVEMEIALNNYELLSYVLSPIIVNGDVNGCVIMMSDERELNDFDVKTVFIASKFLGKYIEE